MHHPMIERDTRTLWLVAHDLTPISDEAARVAAVDAAAVGADLLLLFAGPVSLAPIASAWSSPTPVLAAIERDRAFEVEAERLAERVAARMRATSPGIVVETRVARGEPAAEILATEAELRPARIVLGTHGRRSLRHAVLGSVAERVVRESVAPVLVVKSVGPDLLAEALDAR